jgi:hypothetical protein
VELRKFNLIIIMKKWLRVGTENRLGFWVIETKRKDFSGFAGDGKSRGGGTESTYHVTISPHFLNLRTNQGSPPTPSQNN